MLGSDETLFRNEDAFELDYVPEVFNYRDSQIKALASCAMPALRGQKAVNAIIHGLPATGKTTAAKVIFSQLDLPALHVNCHIDNSPYAIMARIYELLFQRQPPETGTSLNTLYDKILSRLKKPLLVALDDFDSLTKKDQNDVLYNILRAYELGKGHKTSAWVICQKEELMLDSRVRSVFQPMPIKFPAYKRGEIFGILKERVEIGLYPDVMPRHALDKITDYALGKNDLRAGIESIRRAALNAEADSSRKIMDKHLVLESMASDEEKIVSLLREKPLISGQLYELVKKDMGYTKFNKTVNELLTKNLIESRFIVSNKGRTRVFSVKL